jgi:hypothetical protein
MAGLTRVQKVSRNGSNSAETTLTTLTVIFAIFSTNLFFELINCLFLMQNNATDLWEKYKCRVEE